MAFEEMSLADALRTIRQRLAPSSADLGKASVRAYNLLIPATWVSGSLSIPNNTVTTFTPFTAVKQNDTLFTTALPDRITIQRAGYYRYSVSWLWPVNAVGTRSVWSLIDGTAYDTDARNPDAGGNSGGTLTNMKYFTAGQTIGCQFFQNSGGALVVGVDLAVEFKSN